MMNAFISHSVGVQDQYILNLLADKCAQNGWQLVSDYYRSDMPDLHTSNLIQNSVVFLGLITTFGKTFTTNRVYADFDLAKKLNKPSILLVEQGARNRARFVDFPNTVLFNRDKMTPALNKVQQHIEVSKNQQNTNALAWVLGGFAVIALLDYLSDKKNS